MDQRRPGNILYRNAILEQTPAADRALEHQRIERAAPTSAKTAEAFFTVDVEDWFHILDVGCPRIEEWDSLPSRVERNFLRLLDLFSEKGVITTCFFLGWVGERFPHLVREAVRRGHEIASHGYAHRLTNTLTRNQFYDDVLRARQLLEDVSGGAVMGYRSPGFSMAEWIFDTLAEAGYRYDSSIFPAPHGHGGRPGATRKFHAISCKNGQVLFEFPITISSVVGRPMCVSGGGYLRLFPYWFVRRKVREVVDEGQPAVFYIHPREIDPGHPRLPMNAYRRFKSYVNIAGTESKVSHILDDFRMTTFQQYLTSNDGNGGLS